MRRSSPFLLALFAVAADAASTSIDSLDALTMTPPADGCTLSLVAGHAGQAVDLAWANASGGRWAMCTGVAGAAGWDTAAGLSFWVKGDGSSHCGNLEFIWNGDYAQRYAFAFRIDATGWTQVRMPWGDLLPELSGASSVPLGAATAHPPSVLGALGFGKWWYWRDTGACSYAIDDVRLESAIAVDQTDYRPAGDPLARVRAKLLAGQPIQVVTMGDSLTDLNHWTNLTTNWPGYLRAAALADHGSALTLVDPAIGGTELRGNVIMMPTWLQAAPQPDLVTVFFGGNDWAAGMRGAAFRQTIGDAIRRIRRATAGRADVLIMTTCPNPTAWDTMAELAQAGRDAAADEKAGLCDVDALFHAIGGATPERLFASDGVHLSSEGQQRIADAVLAAMEAGGGSSTGGTTTGGSTTGGTTTGGSTTGGSTTGSTAGGSSGSTSHGGGGCGLGSGLALAGAAALLVGRRSGRGAWPPG